MQRYFASEKRRLSYLTFLGFGVAKTEGRNINRGRGDNIHPRLNIFTFFITDPMKNIL